MTDSTTTMMTTNTIDTEQLESLAGLDWTGDLYGRYRLAEQLFEARRYRLAARQLQALLDEVEADDDQGVRHGTDEARLLPARSHFHAAQLHAAERIVRELLEDDPSDAYAALLLGRTLQRLNRKDEAVGPLTRAAAMGQGL